MRNDNIYHLLNISEQVPAELVKKAFRKFARANHPDFHPGDTIKEERFKTVNSAYQSWKLIQGTLNHIRRLRTAYEHTHTAGFRPWTFSCKA